MTHGADTPPELVEGSEEERFDRARTETVRYHEELYRTVELGAPGTWLNRPHRLLGEALAVLDPQGPVVAYDLGAGVGRHTLPLLSELPKDSRVIAVDLLSSALEILRSGVTGHGAVELETQQVDLADLVLMRPAGLVFAFSAIEHLPDVAAVQDLLGRIASSIKPGGVVAVGIFADRLEIDEHGRERAALLESRIGAAEAVEVLNRAFSDFDVVECSSTTSEVGETRHGATHQLRATLVVFLARKRDRPAV